MALCGLRTQAAVVFIIFERFSVDRWKRYEYAILLRHWLGETGDFWKRIIGTRRVLRLLNHLVWFTADRFTTKTEDFNMKPYFQSFSLSETELKKTRSFCIYFVIYLFIYLFIYHYHYYCCYYYYYYYYLFFCVFLSFTRNFYVTPGCCNFYVGNSCSPRHSPPQRALAWLPISCPESSGSLASGWSPGETLGSWNFTYRRISALKQSKLLRGSQAKNLIFFKFSSLSWRPTAGQRVWGPWVRDFLTSVMRKREQGWGREWTCSRVFSSPEPPSPLSRWRLGTRIKWPPFCEGPAG